MTKIYAFCLPTRFPPDVMGYAVNEDGVLLASHMSSSPGWSLHDLGVEGTWKHEIYAKHFPDGFTVEWVDKPESHHAAQKFLSAGEKSPDGSFFSITVETTDD